MSLRMVAGKKVLPLDEDELARRLAAHSSCLLDVGTGDGRFVYRHAGEHPESFAIGLDPVVEAMKESSSKALRKPTRGGRPNALFLTGSAEDLPGPLAGTADLVTVLFPWGSLLRSVVMPYPEVLRGFAATARPAASEKSSRLVVLINASVFQDEDYRQRLRLPELTAARVEEVLRPAYAAAGIELSRAEFLAGDVPLRSSWGQRLVRGSARRSLLLEGEIRGAQDGPGTNAADDP